MFKAEQKDGKLNISFEGRMDTATCSGIEKDVGVEIEKAGKPVIFDLAGVDFVSSAFLRICILAAKTAATGKFQVVNAAPQIKKVFKIAGMDQFLG